MYLRYGNFNHQIGECSVSITRRGNFVNGAQRTITTRWDVLGRLQADTPALVSAAIVALQNAYSFQGQDIGFLFDDGSTSSHYQQSALTYGGTRVVSPPHFPEGKGAEYSTFRNYALAVEWDVLDIFTGLISWVETITLNGGGPRIKWLECRNGPPQFQTVSEQTTFRATQRGEAVGMFSYPVPPDPLFPGNLLPDQTSITRTGPSRFGRLPNLSFSQFGVSWSYSFESDSPLNGLPTIN